MPDGTGTSSPFATPPFPLAEEAMVSVIRLSDQPDLIPKLANTRVNLQLEGHQIVCSFEVLAAQRPGGLFIPCAICCKEEPKFLKGAVLWSPDGHIRLIGHECAVRHFGERYRLMRQQRTQRHDLRSLEDWLLDVVPIAPQMVAECAELDKLAEFVQRQVGLLRRDAPGFYGHLASAARNAGGMLTTERVVSTALRSIGPRGLSSSGGSASEFESTIWAPLRGAEMFRKPDYRPRALLHGHMRKFEALLHQDPLDFVVSLGVTERVGIVARETQAALKGVLALASSLGEARAFFGAESVNNLRLWASLPDNHRGLKIEIAHGRAVFRDDQGGRASLLTTCPDRGGVEQCSASLARWQER